MMNNFRLNLLNTLLCGTIAIGLSACQTTKPSDPPVQAVSPILGDEMIVVLTGAKMPCQFAKPMQCLVAMDEQGKAFGIPYNGIDNFVAQPNKRYTLNIRPKLNQYAPDENGANIVGWHLVEVLSQQ